MVIAAGKPGKMAGSLGSLTSFGFQLRCMALDKISEFVSSVFFWVGKLKRVFHGFLG